MKENLRIKEGDLIALLENNAVRTMAHITPVNDLIEHIEAIDCQCKPTIYINEADALIRHTPIDGRDAVEAANEVLGNKNTDSSKGWETTMIVIPVLCMCQQCEDVREEGPHLEFIHSVVNMLTNKCELMLSEEEIEEVKEAQYHLNVFTGINNNLEH